jgi:hypothetical protein
MGRKRPGLKGRFARYGLREIPGGGLKKSQNNPFDASRFWLNLVMIDFCGFFGITSGNTEEEPPGKEGAH